VLRALCAQREAREAGEAGGRGGREAVKIGGEISRRGALGCTIDTSLPLIEGIGRVAARRIAPKLPRVIWAGPMRGKSGGSPEGSTIILYTGKIRYPLDFPLRLAQMACGSFDKMRLAAARPRRCRVPQDDDQITSPKLLFWGGLHPKNNLFPPATKLPQSCRRSDFRDLRPQVDYIHYSFIHAYLEV